MTFLERLTAAQETNHSWLCVGLDPSAERLPEAVRVADDPLYTFCSAIVDATADLVCAFKPNLAFWLAQGPAGLDALQRVIGEIAHLCCGNHVRGRTGGRGWVKPAVAESLRLIRPPPQVSAAIRIRVHASTTNEAAVNSQDGWLKLCSRCKMVISGTKSRVNEACAGVPSAPMPRSSGR